MKSWFLKGCNFYPKCDEQLKKKVKKVKNILLGGSLFYLTVYLPIVLMTYFTWWYTFNCQFHRRCTIIGYSNALRYIGELTDFFLHKNSLGAGWTAKEKLHLVEVRDILDALALIAVLCIVLLVFTFDRSKISTYALVNLVIVLLISLSLPFFKTFWTEIFHPLLFDNDLWKNNYLDRSFYLMPRIFFKHSMIFLISVLSLLNGIAWISFKKRIRE